MDKIIKTEDIQNCIFNIRDQQVMIDSDLAKIYEVETKVFNQAVKRNINRFPNNFRFQLTQNEFKEYKKTLRSQFVTLKSEQGKHRKYLPYVFTEQGVSMLSAILKSETAIKVSIQIINAFVEMRKFISANGGVFKRLSNLEQKQIETDSKIGKLLNALEANEITPKQNIFYNGQVFDAYTLIADIIRTSKKLIIIIDNYIDDTVLMQLAKRNINTKAVIYTKTINNKIKQDLKKYNSQYPKIEIKRLTTSHDRFMIIDSKTVYHFGASLKDAGKKWFAFSKLDINANDILEKLA